MNEVIFTLKILGSVGFILSGVYQPGLYNVCFGVGMLLLTYNI